MEKKSEVLEVMDQEIFSKLGQREQVRYAIYKKPNITRKELVKYLLSVILLLLLLLLLYLRL